MDLQWHSILITFNSSPEPPFWGYFSVNTATNIIQHFSKYSNFGVNILATTNTNGADNTFVNNNFSSSGTTITTLTDFFDNDYLTTRWSFQYNSTSDTHYTINAEFRNEWYNSNQSHTIIFTPLANEPMQITQLNIQNAVTLWCSYPESAFFKYGHISEWDTSTVTDMSNLFANQSTFNDDISRWNTSNVQNMNSMLMSASAFNADISQWNTCRVTNMDNMFLNAIGFNQDLSLWPVQMIPSIPINFANGSSITKFPNWGHLSPITQQNISIAVDLWFSNQATTVLTYGPISEWDTSAVTDMSGLFANKSIVLTSLNIGEEFFTFNNISQWNTSKVTNMDNMFLNAHVLDQDLSLWPVFLIPSIPINFADGSSTITNFPNWGNSMTTIKWSTFSDSPLLSSVNNFVVDDNGNLYVSCYNNRLIKIDTNGNATLFVDNVMFQGMVIVNGFLYATNGVSDIYRVDINSGVCIIFLTLPIPSSLWGIAHYGGSLYVMNYLQEGACLKINLADRSWRDFITNLEWAWTIDIDKNGNIYIPDISTNIKKYDSNGVFIRYTNIFSSNDFKIFNNSIFVWDTTIRSYNIADGTVENNNVFEGRQSNYGYGIAFDKNSRLYTSDGANILRSVHLDLNSLNINIAINDWCTDENTATIIYGPISEFSPSIPIQPVNNNLVVLSSLCNDQLDLNTSTRDFSDEKKRRLTSLLIKSIFAENTSPTNQLVLQQGSLLPGISSSLTEDLYLFNGSSVVLNGKISTLPKEKILNKSFYILLESGDSVSLETSTLQNMVSISRTENIFNIVTYDGINTTAAVGDSFNYDGLQIIFGSVYGKLLGVAKTSAIQNPQDLVLKSAMPQKSATSLNENHFSMNRVLYTKTIGTYTSQTASTIKAKTFYGENNRDASSVIQRSKIFNAGIEKKSIYSFQGSNLASNATQAKQRVRNSGSVPPKKSTNRSF
jgi:hypothetical protein